MQDFDSIIGMELPGKKAFFENIDLALTKVLQVEWTGEKLNKFRYILDSHKGDK